MEADWNLQLRAFVPEQVEARVIWVQALVARELLTAGKAGALIHNFAHAARTFLVTAHQLGRGALRVIRRVDIAGVDPTPELEPARVCFQK
jgi:hypothetical protein